MAKIGLVTIYQVPNYGSVLQCYATQKVLAALGHDCRIIRYKFPNEWHYNNGLKRVNSVRKFIRTLFPKKKTRVLNVFRNTHYNFTKQYNSLDELYREDWDDYDCFVTGSDQVWNTRFTCGDKFFLLAFVPDGKARFAVASSFASKHLSEQFRAIFKVELAKFKAISIRENNGLQIIKDDLSINKPIKVILDPTLLLSKDEWLSLNNGLKITFRRPYILFYMWTYAFEPRPYIYELTRYFQEKLRCDVIALEGYEDNHYTQSMRMQNKTNASIEEFIDLFSNAELVITSSFHGTAFSLNFGKPFISLVPANTEDDRQTSLIKEVGLSSCIVRIGQDIASVHPFYDVANEQTKLAELRESSLAWIKGNIK